MNDFIKRLEVCNKFLEEFIVHDNDNYDHRVKKIVYDAHGNDELIAMYEYMPKAEDPRIAKEEL
jgi:hypothetical protein